jgi:hypothetical protein
MSTSSLRTRSIPTNLQTTSYDRVSAALWALIMIFAVLAMIVVLMWLQLAQKRTAREATIVPVPSEIGDLKPLGVGDDAEDPGVEEFFEIDVPQLADAVEAITNAVSTSRSLLAEVDGTAAQMGKGRGLGSRDGGGSGRGGTNADRWSIEYEAESINQYVDQLAFFGIEIGFVSKLLDQVELLIDLDTTPQIRPTTKAEERRAYFIHANSRLRSWDLRLATNAGVKPEGKIMVQFYPPAVTAQLAQLEADEAARRGLETTQIRRTTFKSRAAGAGFEYYVADIVPK